VKVACSITASGYGYFKKESVWPNLHGGFRYGTLRTNRRWAFARLTNAIRENPPCILIHLLFITASSKWITFLSPSFRVAHFTPIDNHFIMNLKSAKRTKPIHILSSISSTFPYYRRWIYLKDVFQEYFKDTQNPEELFAYFFLYYIR